MSVFFGGRLITTPTSASVVNDDAMRNQNLSVGNRVGLVGRSAGGKPQSVLRFGSPQDAQRTLGSGELLDAVLAAFDPSNQTGGPFEVVAVRVNPAVQASGTLKAAGAVDVITLLSTNYGVRENLIKIKVEAGSTTGLRLTTQRGTETYTQDNIARRAFSCQYVGALASGTITINGTTCTLAAPAGTTVATIDMTVFATVQDLVDRINLVTDFTASVLDGNYTATALNGLDYVTAQAIKASAFTVTANLQAVVDWLNSTGEGFVTATRVPGVGAVPVVAPFTFLSGGSDGSTLVSDWATGFETLQSADVQWVSPVTGDPAVHALADTHVAYMSSVGQKERRAICGMVAGSTDAQAIAAAKAINSDRTSLVHLGYYNYDATGALVLYPPYMSAALIAGMFSGVNPGTPLTNKTIKVRGLERNLRNPTDTDQLINGGVLCLESAAGGYKVVKSISTWLTNRNYNRVEQSTGVAVDFVSRNVREALDVLRGEKGNPLVLSRAVSIVDSTLTELARPDPQGPGVIVGNAVSPPYKNIKASLDGDVLRVQFECSPVIPVNYVLTTIFAVPFNGVATA